MLISEFLPIKKLSYEAVRVALPFLMLKFHIRADKAKMKINAFFILYTS
jgi:hypothetical protein